MRKTRTQDAGRDAPSGLRPAGNNPFVSLLTAPQAPTALIVEGQRDGPDHDHRHTLRMQSQVRAQDLGLIEFGVLWLGVKKV